MRNASWVVMALGAWILVAGCKNKSDDIDAPPPPIPSAVGAVAAVAPSVASIAEIPPAVQPSAMAAPPAVAAAAKTATAPTAPTTATTPKPSNHAADSAEVKSCCGALRKEATGLNQTTYESAAKTCDAIADLVSKGKTTHEAALTSIRAALRGGKLPAGCH